MNTEPNAALCAAIEAVAWDELEDAYGAATSIPGALCELAFGAADDRRLALAQLFDGLCLERASLAEASAHAVPFLVAIASRGETGAADLLHAMARLAHGTPDPLALATWQALRAELANISGFLRAEHGMLRALGAMLVALLADEAERAPAHRTLASCLTREHDALARVGLLRAHADLGDLEPARAALADAAYCVRLTAALLCLHDAAPPAAAFALIREALAHPAQSEARYGRASELEPLALVQQVCVASAAAAEHLLPDLLAWLVDGVPQGSTGELGALLARFFPAGAPERPSLAQAALVATIARNRHFFTQHGEVRGVLTEHGLPYRARPLRAYAERGPRAHVGLVPVPAEAGPPARILAAARLAAGRAPLERLELVGEATDELLALLAELPALRRLGVKSAPISARGFSALAALSTLRVLELSDLALDVAGGRVLARSRSIESLMLSDLTLADGALSALSRLPALRFLSLVACPVGELGNFDTLTTLSVESATLGALEVRTIAVLPRLGALHLVEVEAPDLRALGHAAALFELTLRGMDVAYLSLPPTLRTLALHDCKVTPEALAALAACPELTKLVLPRALGAEQQKVLSSSLPAERLRTLLPHLFP